MSITLYPLNTDAALSSVEWRIAARPSLRTAKLLSEEDQIAFLNNPPPNSRYFSLCEKTNLIGMGGFTSISPENRHAEISLLIDPQHHRKGYGTQAVHALLTEAFLNINLHHIYGECYHSSPALAFWLTIIEQYQGEYTILPSRKFWNGQYHNAIFFTLYASKFMKGLPTHA